MWTRKVLQIATLRAKPRAIATETKIDENQCFVRGGVSVVCGAALGRPAKVSPIEHAIVRIFNLQSA